jgi:hypothetical protein
MVSIDLSLFLMKAINPKAIAGVGSGSLIASSLSAISTMNIRENTFASLPMTDEDQILSFTGHSPSFLFNNQSLLL